MGKSQFSGDRMSVLAVLGAAAREAEELIAVEQDLTEAAAHEADRRLKLFMQAAREVSR
jgi:hypothetical protein